MLIRTSVVLLLLAGCADDATMTTWLAQTQDCSLTGQLDEESHPTGSLSTFSGASCRMYMSPTTFTIQGMNPGTSGSFTSPDVTWFRASIPAGADIQVNHLTFENGPLPDEVPPGGAIVWIPPSLCGIAGQDNASNMFVASLSADATTARIELTFHASCFVSGGGSRVFGTLSASGSATVIDPSTMLLDEVVDAN